MWHQHTLEKLSTLRLTGMARAFEPQRAQPAAAERSFEERFGLLVDQEILYRDNRRLARLLKAAKWRLNACVEEFDYRHPRGIDRSFMSTLASGQWIERHHNLAITGPTGSGKTWLACALGHQACRQGGSVRYFRLPRLFESLRIAHGDGTYPRWMNQLAKTKRVILDDWGLQKMATAQRHDLMEVIEDRPGVRATLIAGQRPVEHWHEYIGEATLADAILDRLLHNAHRLPLKGDSLRKRHKDTLDPEKSTS
jgi:DNA replication protein DnaC